MDKLTSERRSELMAQVRSKDTGPEVAVRKVLHAKGIRFRLHRTDLPGKPDIVIPRRRMVIFVHGCFWHGHVGCPKGRLPKSNLEYWKPKIVANRKRDEENTLKLRAMGWAVLTIWQCEIKDLQSFSAVLDDVLGRDRTEQG